MRQASDERFMALAHEAGDGAGCDRGRSGCVVIRDETVLARGHAGPTPGMPSCEEVGHLLVEVRDQVGSRRHCVRLAHAEQMAISEAGRLGVALRGATFYCTMEPCRACAMAVVLAGATRVVAHRRYHDGGPGRRILAAGDVQLVVWLDEVVTYPDDAPPVPEPRS